MDSQFDSQDVSREDREAGAAITIYFSHSIETQENVLGGLEVIEGRGNIVRNKGNRYHGWEGIRASLNGCERFAARGFGAYEPFGQANGAGKRYGVRED